MKKLAIVAALSIAALTSTVATAADTSEEIGVFQCNGIAQQLALPVVSDYAMAGHDTYKRVNVRQVSDSKGHGIITTYVKYNRETGKMYNSTFTFAGIELNSGETIFALDNGSTGQFAHECHMINDIKPNQVHVNATINGD